MGNVIMDSIIGVINGDRAFVDVAGDALVHEL